MFRFSLSTLLICIFVSALVLSYCMNRPVETNWWSLPYNHPAEITYVWTDSSSSHGYALRSPTKAEILVRLAWAEPLAIVATLLAIQGVRKIWRSIRRDAVVAAD